MHQAWASVWLRPSASRATSSRDARKVKSLGRGSPILVIRIATDTPPEAQRRSFCSSTAIAHS